MFLWEKQWTYKDAVKSARMMLMVAGSLVFFSMAVVPSESMEPTLQTKDLILYQKIADVENGDVVLFNSPTESHKRLVKRIVATEGQVVSAVDGQLMVDGVWVDEPYVQNWWDDSFEEQVVPEGSIFVMGDNRRMSSDSREFGFLRKDDVLAKAVHTVLPLSHWGAVE